MQGKRTRALDSRGRPVPGLYVRDRRFIAGFKLDGRWTMRTLEAETLTDARRERDGLLAGLREGRIATPDTATFVEVFAEHQDARSLAERTRVHEQQLVDRHLAELKRRRVQDVTATELARLLHDLRGRYAPWTCVAVYRILRGTFALALRRGIVTRSPIDGLAPSERPKQRNAKQVAVLDAGTMKTLVEAGTTERWRAALGLAGYAGLRASENCERSAGATSTSRRARLPWRARCCVTERRSRRRLRPERARSRCCRRFAACWSRGGCARRRRGRTTS